MSIPAGSQSGSLFRLKNRGAPDLRRRGLRGDQIVRLQVETPTRVTRKQKELLRSFDELQKKKGDSLVSGFADKVRELYV
jgi:molecular chaperone DnaJ